MLEKTVVGWIMLQTKFDTGYRLCVYINIIGFALFFTFFIVAEHSWKALFFSILYFAGTIYLIRKVYKNREIIKDRKRRGCCPECDYPMSKSDSITCPECGFSIDTK